MSPDEFRAAGRATIEWIARYLETLEEHPVRSPASPGDLRRALPAHPPVAGESFDAILSDLDRLILPGITHWQHPSFFAFFPANASPPAILGELVSAGLGVQGMLWATSPAATELETHVLDWLVEALDLPAGFRSDGRGGGVIQDSASSATLCALLAARDRAGGAEVLPRLTLYASPEAHSSILKAARIAGFADEQLRWIETDADLAMRPEALADAIAADRRDDRIPCWVCATVGTTSTTALDPVPAIAKVCAETGVWLHVDAAYAGSAAICPELRFVNAGLQGADSYCFNPHKWLLTNFDCTAMWVADRQPLLAALSVLPEYLRNRATEAGDVIDYRDWHVPLGRRFRALKLWFVIRSYGIAGLQDHIRGHVQWTADLADRIDAHPSFVRVGPAPLGLVCFRHIGGDDVNQGILDEVNASGALYLTHTRVHDQLVLRMAIGGRLTRAHHVHDGWDRIVAAAPA